jgi:hypothetical protein
MANILNLDVCKFNAASAGSGSFVVSSPVTGYQSPVTAGATSSNSYRYRAESGDLTQWEVGTGIYTSSNVTLTRAPLINSAGGSSAINFSAAPQVGMGMILQEDINGTGQIVATQTNDSANAGNVGEYNSVTATSSTLTSASPANITSFTLASGEWDLFAPFTGSGSAAPSVTVFNVSISSATATTNNLAGQCFALRGTTLADPIIAATIGPFRVQISSATGSTTYYLNTNVTYSGGTFSVTGLLRARRPR